MGGDPVQVQPTLYIGLGKTGAVCLAEICRRQMHAAGSRFLTMAIDTGNGQQYTDAHPGECITWQVDLDQAVRLAGRDPGLSWWKPGPAGSSRLNGRMSYLLQFRYHQELGLKNFISNAKTDFAVYGGAVKINVFVIVSLREMEAGFLSDLLIDLNFLMGNQLHFLLPCLVMGPKQENPGWAAASLREVERLRQNGRQVVSGAYDVENRILEAGLFSHYLLADTISSLPALADQLSVMSDWSTAQRFLGDLANVPPSATEAVMLVSASYSFYVPVDAIRSVCAARVLKNEFLCSSGENLEELILVFLQGDPSDVDWLPFQLLLGALTNEAQQVSKPYKLLHAKKIFQNRLKIFFDEIIISLDERKAFLDKLVKTLEKGQEALIRVNKPLANEMYQYLPEFRSVIRDFRNAIDTWRNQFGVFKQALNDLYQGHLNDLQNTMGETEYEQIALRSEMGLDQIVDLYYKELQGQTGWLDKLHSMRSSLRWKMECPGIGEPYMRCVVNGQQLADTKSIMSSLWNTVYAMTQNVAEHQTVFDYLGGLDGREIRKTFDQIRPLVKFDPIFSKNRVTYEYLVSSDNPMRLQWGIKDRRVNFITGRNENRLTYFKMTYNLPLEGSLIFNEDLEVLRTGVNNIPRDYFNVFSTDDSIEREKLEDKIYVDSHEQNSRYFERQLLISSWLPACLVRLMHDRDAFEVAMWCVALGWVQFVTQDFSSSWMLTPEGNPGMPLSGGQFTANKIADALENMLIRYPYQDMGGVNPFTRRLYQGTMDDLQKLIEARRKEPDEMLMPIFDALQGKINLWQASGDHFENALAVFQQYLLDNERKKNSSSN